MSAEQTITEALMNSPEEVRNIISSEPWAKKINELVRSNIITEEQAESINNEVFFVLLKMEPISDLPANLKENTGLSDEQVFEISSEIYSSTFDKVIHLLVAQEENAETDLPVIAEDHHPVIKEGESVHDTETTENKPSVEPTEVQIKKPEEKPVEQQTTKLAKPEFSEEAKPKNSYPSGQDPYREPLV